MTVVCVHCSKCRDYVFSRTRHDFRYCSCKNVAIDGGEYYTKIVGDITSKTYKIEIPQTEKELFDDWNNKKEQFGILSSIEGMIVDN